MKSVYKDMAETMDFIDDIRDYNEHDAMIIICMMIDTVSAMTGRKAGKIVDDICTLVKLVNADLGDYQG